MVKPLIYISAMSAFFRSTIQPKDSILGSNNALMSHSFQENNVLQQSGRFEIVRSSRVCTCLAPFDNKFLSRSIPDVFHQSVLKIVSDGPIASFCRSWIFQHISVP